MDQHQTIYFTNKDFDFSLISLSQPVSVQGGAYITKIKYNGEPFYIQSPTCSTKQGLNETNKKAYIDLMYTNEDEEVIEWFEHLEERLIQLIFEKRDIWFQNEMDRDDIESFFNPICRAFKGGKFHLIRINIPKNKTNSSQYICNVYDENENVSPVQDLNESHTIIPVVEVHGIKFSARNFQIEFVGKQFMLLNNKPLFNSCVIKRDVIKMDNNINKPVHIEDTDVAYTVTKLQTIENNKDDSITSQHIIMSSSTIDS